MADGWLVRRLEDSSMTCLAGRMDGERLPSFLNEYRPNSERLEIKWRTNGLFTGSNDDVNLSGRIYRVSFAQVFA